MVQTILETRADGIKLLLFDGQIIIYPLVKGGLSSVIY